MKRHLIAILLMTLLLAGCDNTDKPGEVKLSGTDTIDNILYGAGPYYAFGFSFSSARKVSSLANPGPDIIISVYQAPDILILQTDAGLNGFSLAGEYDNAILAEQAFDNLTSPVVTEWDEWANPIKPNQVWIFRSATEHYAKFRIISIVSEVRNSHDYAECTFEWVYQPDGTLTFPGK
jgi:hypothetical protein